jgi:site-specific DNA recombinase
MSMGREARAKQGKYAGSWRLPIGYDYIHGELIPNEYEADLIRKMFEDYSGGKSSRAIAKDYNSKGLFHKYGKWNADVIGRLLQSKTYIGYVKFGSEWYKGTHEPIIDDDLFLNVQKVHQRRLATEHNGSGGRPTSYLGGMVYCKRCGAKYIKYHRSSIHDGKKYAYDYYCCFSRAPKTGAGTCKNDTWRMEELDELIFNEIRKLKFTTAKRSKTPNKPNIIDKRINELNKQLERIMTLYTLGEMPLDIIQKKVHEINVQKAKLEQVTEDIKVTPEEAKRVVKSFDDLLEKGSIEDVRTAIKSLIDRIEIDGENVYIYWSFD